ncbi:restriction endonuclease subunit S [Methanobrevibacter filiformis]|uniref:EcoKI restriction-modification system protein HsdS n=1 Tax=Methanobrevibacter filiformis TaxID=55758 RepID=A0A165ZNW7_9EURY|nr:restriction endonuclease subunit S [Methanobrevibacter filiformis]KZX10966.1 EcoKI restriction-modification system protein HsdS [Methanobrevibacter filiformis]
MSKNNTPKLRFPEFSDHWEEKKLGEIAYIKGRIGWKNLKQSEYTEDGPYLIAGKHIHNGVIHWKKCDHISYERYKESEEIALENGDIIFSKDGSLGNPALIENLKVEATINGTMMLVRFGNNLVNPSYFYQILNSNYFFRLLYVLKSGSSIPHIFQRDMKNFKFPLSKIKEQTKIANFLTQVDEKINLLEKKLDIFKDFKKFCLQQLFAQKLRFKNANDENYPEWEKISLGKIAAVKKGFTPSTNNSSNWDEGDIPWLSIADMKKGKYLDHTSKQITKKGSNDKDMVKKGSLIMSFKLTIGRLAILNRDMYTNEAICNFQWYSSSVLTEYMYYYLNSINMKKYGSQAAKGITLNNDSLETIPIKLPIFEEQEKIANFLINLDNKLDKIAIELENTKEFKKGLLQQMFI